MSFLRKKFKLVAPEASDRKEVRVLGVESTSHTLGIGVVEYANGEVAFLANAFSQYKPTSGGIHPRESFVHHVNVAHEVLSTAIEESGVNIADIDVFAVAVGPGLGPCLRVGASLARFLSAYLNKPLAPVNHAVAHIEIGKLVSSMRDPLIVYISGGNTMIVIQRGQQYRVFGETLDIPLGNLLDSFAREVGIAPPYTVGGDHAIDICSEWGESYISLPYTVKGCDLSFSGLLTAALKVAKTASKDRKALGNVCMSLRETAFNMLVEVTERALMLSSKESILLVGGVASNKLLRSKMEQVARFHGVRYYGTPPEIAGDNGLMIAYAGLLHYLCGKVSKPEEVAVRQRLRLDEATYPWLA
ncbi:MAG: KEOPS complex N(6)-L-threonylcarbamoyladenine synthase Kae1 [Desulfurococcaceae archaeon]